MDHAFRDSGAILYHLFNHCSMKDPQLLYTRQHSPNKANAASVMNCKGDPAVMSKPVEMKCKLTLKRAFL